MGLEIVQVTYKRVPKDTREVMCFDDYVEAGTSYEDWSEELVLYDWRNNVIAKWPEKEGDPGWNEAIYTDYQEDWHGLQFTCVGQMVGLDGYQPNAGLAFEVQTVGPSDVFEDWLKDLRQIGERLLRDDAAEEYRPEHEHNDICFLTLWEYEVSGDAYWGDVDIDYNLVGLIDPNRLNLALKDKEGEVK